MTRPLGRRQNGLTDRCGDVDPLVGPGDPQNRVPTVSGKQAGESSVGRRDRRSCFEALGVGAEGVSASSMLVRSSAARRMSVSRSYEAAKTCSPSSGLYWLIPDCPPTSVVPGPPIPTRRTSSSISGRPAMTRYRASLAASSSTERLERLHLRADSSHFRGQQRILPLQVLRSGVLALLEEKAGRHRNGERHRQDE